MDQAGAVGVDGRFGATGLEAKGNQGRTVYVGRKTVHGNPLEGESVTESDTPVVTDFVTNIKVFQSRRELVTMRMRGPMLTWETT